MNNMTYQSVAGSFMPFSKEEQDKLVNNYLSDAHLLTDSGKIKAVIVPHAGYIYSGRVAASGFKQLSQVKVEKVILVGPSHREYYQGILKGIADHSVEVQLPFIRNIIPEAKIIPLVYGDISHDVLADEIKKNMCKSCVIIISSDLSHYYPYEEAVKLDALANRYIPALNLEKIREDVEACGKTGILSIIKIAREKKWQARLLEYKNSGDTVGERSSVVGYGSYGFYSK